jgi:hypothetical protein
MSVVEHSDGGTVPVPTGLPPSEGSRTGFVLDVCDGLTVLRPADNPEPIWKNPDPVKRVESFLQWTKMPRPPAPDIPLEFFDRDYLYD